MKNKIKGALFGLAVGDALGVTTEFMTKKQIQHTYGRVTEMRGRQGLFAVVVPGEVSDDTDMTISVAEGILTNPEHPIEDIGKNFISWYKSDPKDIGIIIKGAIKQFNGDWFDTAEKLHRKLFQKTAGNGTLMRCLPVALLYSNEEKMKEITILQSKMTHYDSLADEACLIYNRIARRLLHGEEFKSSIQLEIKGTRYEDVSTYEPKVAPDGFVVNTMTWVLHLLLTYPSYEKVILEAVNNGHDSDTVAAIAGGLAGLYYGFYSIPPRYVNQLLYKDKLEDLSQRILHFRNQRTTLF